MIHLPERLHKNVVLCFLSEHGRAVPSRPWFCALRNEDGEEWEHQPGEGS